MRRRELLPAAMLVLLLATFLRFHLLGAQSFWNDEGNSARLSERPIPAIIEGTASDVHPPLYYLLLRGWREPAGETEFGLRALSAFAGVLVVAGVMAVAARGSGGAGERGSRRAGEWGSARRITGYFPLVTIIAGLLAAVNPALVYYSQETRMYSLLALLAVGSTWALLNWLGAARSWGWAAAYTALLAAGLYTHYFFPAVVAGQGLVVVLWWLERRDEGEGMKAEGRGGAWRRVVIWAGMAAVAVAIYGPWLPVLARQIGGRAGAGESAADFLAAAGRWLALGGTMPEGEAAWAVAALAALAVIGLVAGWRRSLVPLVMIVVPVGAAVVLGATDPAFFKFLLAAAPFVAVLAGMAWQARWGAGDKAGGGEREWKRAPLYSYLVSLIPYLVAGLTVAVVAGSLLSLGHMYHDPAFARADYRAMAARIAAERHPNAGIVLVAPNQWEAFTYYHRDGAPVYPLPRGRPDPAALAAELEQIAATHDRIYALFWGEAQRDPERVVERWLDAHAFKAAEEWVGDVRFVVYAVAREMAAEPTASGAQFAGLDGETITLEEYAVWPQEALAGEVVQVRLVWSADATPSRPYKVFVHLLDGSGAPVAQRDSEPVGGSRPTTSWAAGESIEDNLGVLLPLGLPAGSYELRVGLYDAFDPGVRLAVDGGDGVLLGGVAVEE